MSLWVNYITHAHIGDFFSYSVLELPEKDQEISKPLGFLQI